MAKTTKHFKHMTPEEFGRIKTISKMGFGAKRLAVLTGRSLATVGLIRRSKDFTEYTATIQAYAQNSGKKQVKEEKDPTTQEFNPSLETRTVNALERIASALEKMADAS